MKKLIFIIAALALIGSLTIHADEKKEQKQVTTVFVTDIHCENCSTKIMNNVHVLGKGIKDVEVNLDDKTVAVTYDPTKNDPEKIAAKFKTLNVTATVKPACDKPAVSCDKPVGGFHKHEGNCDKAEGNCKHEGDCKHEGNCNKAEGNCKHEGNCKAEGNCDKPCCAPNDSTPKVPECCAPSPKSRCGD